ncbi:hypothetical protein KI387_006560, partial [Taxus chinensis]
YSTIAWEASAHNGQELDVSYAYQDTTVANIVFNVFNALGQITFSYARHNVLLEIQAIIPSTSNKPSKVPMWRVVVVAYIIVAICYFLVPLVGYWAFGADVGDNVLITLCKPMWLIAMENLMVVIHVIGSYQGRSILGVILMTVSSIIQLFNVFTKIYRPIDFPGSRGYSTCPFLNNHFIYSLVFNALGQITFSYAGHNVVLEIQATIPSTPNKPSKVPMWRGVVVAYIVVAVCYFPVSLVGYWAFGADVGDNVLITLGKPRWLIAMANLMVAIHVIGSYQKDTKKFIDDWLPFTGSRNVKWWYSTFHNVTAMVGGGVLSLPSAMTWLGCYSTIAWGASTHNGQEPDVSYAYRDTTVANTVFGVFNALGQIAFAYAGHNVVLEIQATIPSTPNKPSKVPMWRGVVVAYIVVVMCYFPVSLVGYWAFRADVGDNVLITLGKPRWLIAMANLMVVIHVIGSYQVCIIIGVILMTVSSIRETNILQLLSVNLKLQSFNSSTAEKTMDSNDNNNQKDTKKSVDDWLPVTGSRNAKWWYSAFHNVTAMVGAGVLSLPSAMTWLGWGPGVIVLVLSWIITLYTLWQMVEMHEMVPGKRFDRYHELGQEAFGQKLGLWVVVPQQLIVEVGVDIVYMVTGGRSLKKFHETVCPSCKHIKQSFWIVIFGSVHVFLAQLPNFNSITMISVSAAVMSLSDTLVIDMCSYSTIAWGASAHNGQEPDVSYAYRDTTVANTVFGVFNALGQIAFAYAGHNVVLEIQATIPSTPNKPSKVPMWRGVVVAYIVVAICYFPVSLVGYWAFGADVGDNVLITLGKPRWLIAMANLMVVIHVIGSYQIYAMPVFDMMETVLVKKMHLTPGWPLRLVARTTYVDIVNTNHIDATTKNQNTDCVEGIIEVDMHSAQYQSQTNETYDNMPDLEDIVPVGVQPEVQLDITDTNTQQNGRQIKIKLWSKKEETR